MKVSCATKDESRGLMAPDAILGVTILLFILSYPSHLSIDLLISILLRLFTFTKVARRWF